MAKTDFKSVDEYLASQPETVQPILGRVRDVIRAAVPEAQESISYKMPTYTLNGHRLLHFASWKEHYSLYAATEQLMKAFPHELALFVTDKGTIRFPLSQPVPEELIGRIAVFRAKEIAERLQSQVTEPENKPKTPRRG